VTAKAQSSRKNNDIEILRAFAILYTILLHLRVLLPADSAFLIPLRYLDLSVGVDLFLVISGFVITGSLIDSTRHTTATRRPLMFSFWIKRIFRLLPAAWTWVIIACVIQLLIIGITDIPYSLRNISLSTAAALGNAMNIYVPYCLANGGGQHCVINNFLGHYWSLSLEEQFYLVFPFLFFFLGRKSLVILLIAAVLAQLMWQRPFFSYAWHVKTDALCWGILLGLLAERNFHGRHIPALLRRPYLARTAGLALLALLPLIAASSQGIATVMKPYGVALVAVICAAIVWLASHDRNVFSVGHLYQRVMLYIGSRSYSLYLSHLVVYMSTRDLLGYFGEGLAAGIGAAAFNTLHVLVAVGLTFLGAELTYRFVETVLRARGRLIAARQLPRNP
jgi:peptidoglycan/LPS O-acetylase OafA/YrhL